MRKLLFLLVLVMSACSSIKSFDTLAFTTDGHIVFYQGYKMAEVVALEYALDDGKFTKEVTLRLLNPDFNAQVPAMLAFLHKKQPSIDIEVDIPMEDIFQPE